MIEETGRSREEAVARALATLGITHSEAVVTVVEEKKHRFLGLFGDPLVRVRVERRRRANGSEGSGAREARRARGSHDGRGREKRRDNRPVDTSGDAERVRDIVAGVLGVMGVSSRVAVVEVNGMRRVNVESSESDGLLIGRHGQTLAALEHIANRILTRARDDRPVVEVDIGGYRERTGDREEPFAPAEAGRRGRRRSRARTRVGAVAP